MQFPRKQVVLFFDLLGFNDFYKFIAKQNSIEGQKMAFKVNYLLYKKYLERLKTSVQRSIEKAKEYQSIKKEVVESSQIQFLSDSIVVVMDCVDESDLSHVLIILSGALMSLMTEIIKPEIFTEENKQFGFTAIFPIRGAISYGLSEIDFTSNPPIVYGLPYASAYYLEQKIANWQRIIIDPNLNKKISDIEVLRNAFTFNIRDGLYYFDFLKMTYTASLKFKEQNQKYDFLKKIFHDYKRHIELNFESSKLTSKNKSFLKKRKIRSKYKYWIKYYNNTIDWIVKTDIGFKEIGKSLMFRKI